MAEYAGECPVCGSDSLTYGRQRLEHSGIFYPWVCNDCNATGEEHYKTEFVSHQNVKEGKHRNDRKALH